MPRRATYCAVLCVLASWHLSACSPDDGQGTADRPSVTASLSPPTRTLPSRTRSPEVPEQTETEPRPSRTPALSPDTTRPPPPTTREPEPEPEPQQTATRTSTLIAVPVPTATSAAPSPSPAGEVGAAAAEETVSPAAWIALGLLLVAATIGTWLLVRARKGRAWRTRLQEATAEVAWFARDLVPQLRTSGSIDRVAGGWHVAVPRVAAAEDELTVLSPSAPSQEDAARALQLRDAVRAARERLDSLSGPGRHDEWALDLDDVEALLVAALGPTEADRRGAVPRR